MTLPPPNFPRTRKRDDAGCIRGRAGGLRLLASLVLENLYASDCAERGTDGTDGSGSEDCAGDCSDISSSVSCLTSDDGSDSSSDSSSGSSSSSSSSNERPSDRIAGSRSKRRKK